MIKTRALLIFLSFLSFGFVNAQNQDSVPNYSTFLEELENDNLEIDYRQFRISYIYSDQFKEKGASNYAELKKDVYKYIRKKKYGKVIDVCQKMLEIDYTSMFAHKYIQQTAKILEDTVLYKKHHHIEFGLLKSIVHNGDGKSCKTSWEVTQIEEEYFILSMIGAELNTQTLEGLCDRMDVTQDNDKKTYYFGVYYVFESRK